MVNYSDFLYKVEVAYKVKIDLIEPFGEDSCFEVILGAIGAHIGPKMRFSGIIKNHSFFIAVTAIVGQLKLSFSCLIVVQLFNKIAAVTINIDKMKRPLAISILGHILLVSLMINYNKRI